jgi:hypothetical protein
VLRLLPAAVSAQPSTAPRFNSATTLTEFVLACSAAGVVDCSSLLKSQKEGKKKEQGHKGHFMDPLSSKAKNEYLLGPLSTSKFDKNRSIFQQILPFSMSTSKEVSLSMSCSKF